MVVWVIETLYITRRKFHKKYITTIAAFTAEAFYQIYQFPIPQYVYEKMYMEELCKQRKDPMELIKELRSDLKKHKK